MNYFEKIGTLKCTIEIEEKVNDILISLIIGSVFKQNYKKDYLQVITFEENNENIIMHIKQEKTNRVEEKDTKIEFKKGIFNIPSEKIYFIEDIYPNNQRVQTLLFSSEY